MSLVLALAACGADGTPEPEASRGEIGACGWLGAYYVVDHRDQEETCIEYTGSYYAPGSRDDMGSDPAAVVGANCPTEALLSCCAVAGGGTTDLVEYGYQAVDGPSLDDLEFRCASMGTMHVFDPAPALEVDGDTALGVVSGQVSVPFRAYDASGLERVEVLSDDTRLATSSEEAATLVVDTCAVEDGDRLLVVRATDEGGQSTEVSLEATVSNPLEVALAAPAVAQLAYFTTFSVDVGGAWSEPTLAWSVDGEELATESWPVPAEDCAFDCGCHRYEADLPLGDWPAGAHEVAVTVTELSGESASIVVEVVIEPDGDGDGYASTAFWGGDCADGDPEVYPGAAFAESSTACMRDHDADGYGDARAESPLDVGSDCDDRDASVNPGAVEVCDLLDDDCDGVADQGSDDDEDGYAVPCDCDDSAAEVHPDASETCNNGQDDDCAGKSALCSLRGGTTARSDATWTGSVTEGAVGTSVAAVPDLDGDGLDEWLLGAPGAGADEAGAVYLVSGTRSPASSVLGESELVMEGGADRDALGTSVAAVADLDGDGLVELAIGAPDNDDGGVGAGAVYLLPSASGGDTVAILGLGAGDAAGSVVRAAGDLTGDGVPDIVLGVPSSDQGASRGGAASVLSGADLDGATALGVAGVYGDAASDMLGADAEATSDMDGDGVADLVVGAPGRDDGGSTAGAVYAFLGGGLSTWEPPSSADVVLLGEAAFDEAGSALSGLGDFDGDGLDDLVVGAPSYDSDAGAAYVILGSAGLASTDVRSASAGVVAGGADSETGTSVAGLGDVDYDGLGDVLLGGPGAGTAGEAYLVLGGNLGISSTSAADAVYEASAAGEGVGAALGGGADHDGDGAADFVLGAPTSGVDAEGAVSLFLGLGE